MVVTEMESGEDGGTITHDKNRQPKTSLCSSREC